ncbi:hypothetical protein P152DRAFT_462536 [Eremomyces bilateralis CBS 781.70]|uniref:Dynamin-type G domain-containing protein n=1 Tax=Eremomyces bilateralis CBS 781.70 TaxID=1392243 RepID=A0A6G1FRI2_9PEZI|nr:uncharacterized protein P152DRAFT_462536 [Eremomyces bilateralis CBS 781.70]KAF1808404.1 hypothetical protein P152DRAFT_462536 [Eremomyces bilateralis CBS 781.70]
MRRASAESITTKIIPDKNRSTDEQDRLKRFELSISNFSELPELIHEATVAMGLLDEDGANKQAFARDVLSIEISGPGYPQLTLVDLPGLIHSGNKSQSETDVQLIHDLVDEYIANPRTIILAVISAENDYAGQIILKKARLVDPKGSHTLGIITKPGFLRAGSDNERAWLDLAANKDIYFGLGRHMVKNRADREVMTLRERNEVEMNFFSKGAYKDLPRDQLGIDSLYIRLSNLLVRHLERELPSLKRELDQMLADVQQKLKEAGVKRTTPGEQRQFLTAVGAEASEILKCGVQGQYEHPFFPTIATDKPVDAQDNHTRLRALVQFLNHDFARRMHEYGHKYAVEPKDRKDADKKDEQKSDYLGLNPKVMDWEEGTRWVLNILRELQPLDHQPTILGDIDAMGRIAMAHVENVAKACAQFTHGTISTTVPEDVASKIWSLKVDPRLRKQSHSAKDELRRVLKDNRGHLISYNP